MTTNQEAPIRSFLEGSAAPLNLSDMADILLGQWRIVLGCVFLGVAASTYYAFTVAPVYRADTLIQIEEKKGSSIAGLQQIATALDVSQSQTAGEIDILKSREVLGQAIQALNLDIRSWPDRMVPYFSTTTRSLPPDTLREPYLGMNSFAWGGERINVGAFHVPDSELDRTFHLLVGSSGRWSLLNSEGDTVADGLVGTMVTFSVGGLPADIRVDKIIARQGQSFSLKKISLVAAYDQLLDELRIGETSKQSSVVRVTCDANGRNLAVQMCDEIAKAYLVQNVSRRSEEAEHSLRFLNDQLPQLQKDVERAEEALNEYRLSRKSVNLDKESEALLTRSVDLEKQRLETEMKGQMLAERFQPNHPDVVALNAQIGEIKGEQEKLSHEVQQLPETEQQFLRLQRDVKVNTDLYISLLNNAQQLRIAKAGTIGNVRVIDFATLPDKPTSPKRVLVVSIGTLVGLLVALAAAFLPRSLRPSIRRVEDLEKVTGLPIYATIPQSNAQAQSVFRVPGRRRPVEGLLHAIHPDDPAIEALRAMRLGLQFATVGSKNSLIVITSPSAQIGKTFVSANFAAVLASMGKRVLLIDCDMRRPRVADYFGLRKEPGLSNLLASEGEPNLSYIHSVTSELDVLCSGSIPPNPGELLARPMFASLLEILEGRYDQIIIDTPPVLPVGDALTISRLAGAIFMVARAEITTPVEVVDALRKLETAGATVNGMLLNGVRISRLGYGYSYHYKYVSHKA
jgi:tyrosine-protein kinase Etk/Wzc